MLILYGKGHGLLGLLYFFSSFPRLVCLLGISSCQINSLGIFSSSFLFPRAFITYRLEHYSPFFTFYVPMGLLPVNSCHVDSLGFYLFSWTLIAHLFYFYLSLCPWACWLSLPAMLAHWAFISFLGLSHPIYFTFTSHYAYGLASCHFLPCWPIWFLPLFLGSRGPFTSIVFLLFFSSFIFLQYWAFFAVGPLV